MTIVNNKSNKNNKNLTAAKAAKNDRFFTQMRDIENELQHYRRYLKGKTVYVNCDGSIESNFRKHLMMAFDIYGLKRLIITSFNIDGSPANKYDITSSMNGDYKKLLATKPAKLKGDGDFRSDECIELLKQADVVIGNPPFSLFRSYVEQIIAHKKKMIILGNANAITFKEIFPLIKANKLWLGVASGAMEFQIPAEYADTVTSSRVDENGNIFSKLGFVRWFTNLTHNKRKEKLIMYKKYSKTEYPKFDNYDAINVNKVAGIPLDYAGAMGVPITFLDRFNPDQFEIVMCDDIRKVHMTKSKPTGLIKDADGKVNGVNKYARIVIRNKNPK